MIVFESNIGKTLNHINGSLNLIANLIKNSENQMLRQIGSLNLIANLIKSSENQLQRQIDVDCQKKHLDAKNRQFVIENGI
ncbi:hypothetical protein KSF78_0008510 [Schistosoma japonicum]|nr:hypothetical protein KSF78_0008510 [Schistosoma japonicum]